MTGLTLTDNQVAVLKAIRMLQGKQTIFLPAHQIRRVVNERLGQSGYLVNLDLTDLARKKLVRSSKRGFYTLTREGRHVASHL